MDDLDLVTAATFLFRHEAEVAAAGLRAEGIASVINADDEGGLNPGFFDEYRIRLVVRREDLALAEAILRADDHDQLVVHPEHVEAISSHAMFCGGLEACGLLAFDRCRLRFVYPLTNTDASPHRFTIDPVEQFRAIQHAERNGWEVGGTFHSHPAGEPVPSPTDVEAGAAGWIHLIVGPGGGTRSSVRAYTYDATSYAELQVIVEAPPVR